MYGHACICIYARMNICTRVCITYKDRSFLVEPKGTWLIEINWPYTSLLFEFKGISSPNPGMSPY